MRLATEFQERKNQRIRREIEEREREEAQALLNDVEKRIKKKGKKPIIEGVSTLSLTNIGGGNSNPITCKWVDWPNMKSQIDEINFLIVKRMGQNGLK